MLTTKQIQILEILVKGDGQDLAGSRIPVDLDQLLERLPYRTTKASMQFSIRALQRRDLICKSGMENRRGRKRVLLSPTPQGEALVSRGSPSSSFIEPEPSSPEALLENLLNTVT